MEGVVFTMYDARTNLSLQVVENVKDSLDQNIYKTIIPRNVRLAEAPSYGMPINYYDKRSTGAGEGHFIHTYMGDGNPLPSFEGEPTWVDIDGDIDEFTDMVWENLNEDNKVSLFVRYIDIATGEYESRIVNKNK
jgi:hypothetical protein